MIKILFEFILYKRKNTNCFSKDSNILCKNIDSLLLQDTVIQYNLTNIINLINYSEIHLLDLNLSVIISIVIIRLEYNQLNRIVIKYNINLESDLVEL